MMRYKVAWIVALTLLLAGFLVPAYADVDSASDLSSVGVQIRETELGDLVADALRASCGTPVSLVPAGCLREMTVPKGKVGVKDIAPCLQYPADHVAVIELTGSQLADALERGVSLQPRKFMGFLHVSGLQFRFDPDAPKGSRVKSVIVGKQELQKSKTYRVATTEPLAGGAYGYFTVWGKDLPKQVLDPSMEKSLADYLSGRNAVDYRELNRILPAK